MDATKLPTWLRIILVAGAAILIASASLYAWHWYARPATLTIAVGSLDGEASKLVSALASKLVQQKAPVRLDIVEAGSAAGAAEAFSSGKVDLAVVRGDVGDLSQAQAVAVVTHTVLLLVAPPGSAITDIAGLKRLTVGVVGGDINQRLVKVLTDEYDLARSGVIFKNVGLADVRRMIDSREIRAVLIVMPLAEKYFSLLRSLFPQGGKSGPTLIPIESAPAIAQKERAYESFDLPKGTLRGSPPNPAEDITTLRTSFYLVAQKKLGSDLVAGLTESVMKARRELLADYPLFAQVSAADTEASAYLPAHPGAAEFYNGTQVSFLDKWGNIIFLAPMIAGAVASVLAASFKFLRAEPSLTREEALDVLYALGRRIRGSSGEAELDEIEREIDRVLHAQRLKRASGEGDVVALNVAAHRLENLIHDRRLLFGAQQAGALRD
ncbi:TAXI family TRAP transporter solute-binding subunit [Tardiphaga sp. 768_D3_N2_1]|uniref:TAXI family TRAP transporter solute-binding subunit n=1 Tax=Tardiphaga sp. 768_D3_N2_1 TaxID=3240783 RepID=UPI003F8AA066